MVRESFIIGGKPVTLILHPQGRIEERNWSTPNREWQCASYAEAQKTFARMCEYAKAIAF